MGKRIVMYAVCVFTVCMAYAEIYKDIETVKVFPTGTGEGALLVVPVGNKAEYYQEGKDNHNEFSMNGPSAFCFDDKGFLYVMDYRQQKIVVTAPDLKYERTIKISGVKKLNTFLPRFIQAYNDGIFFCTLHENEGIIGFDSKLKWYIQWDSSYQKMNFYYDDSNKLLFQYFDDNAGIACFPDLIYDFVSDNRLVNQEQINEYLKRKQLDRIYYIDDSNRLVRDGKIIKYDRIMQSERIGTDYSGNTVYSNNGTRIIIQNQDNKTIKYFDYSDSDIYDDRAYYPAVHPSGDIFLLEYPKRITPPTLRRIKNDWDPEGRERWYREHAYIADSNVRVRSKPDLTGEKLGSVQRGDIVQVLDKSAEPMQIEKENAYWYKIKTTGDMEGWVYGAYVYLGDSRSSK